MSKHSTAYTTDELIGLHVDLNPRPDDQAAAARVLRAHHADDVAEALGIEVAP